MKRPSIKKLWKNKKVRFFLISGLFLLCVLATALIILHSQAFKSYLIKKADKYLQTHYQLSLQVGSVSYNLPRLSLELQDIKVNAKSSTAFPLESFSSHRIFLDLGYSTLFSKKIHIQRLAVSQPQIMVKQGWHSSQESAPKETSPQNFVNLRIDDFRLENGSLNLKNHTIALNAALNDINSEIRYVKKDLIHAGFLQAQKGILQLQESTVKLNKLGLEFHFDNNSLLIDRFHVDSDAAALQVSGEVHNYQQNPRFRLEAQASFPLGTIAQLLNLDKQYTGSLTMTASVEGEGDKWNLTGGIKAENSVLHNIPIPKLETAFQGNESDFSVDILDLEVAQGHLEGKANLPLSTEKPFFASLQWEDLNLSHFSDIFPTLPFRIASTTSGKITARGEVSNLSNLDGEGNLTFKPFKSGSALLKNKHFLNGRIKFKASQGDIEILPSELAIDHTRLFLSGRWDKNSSIQTGFRLEADDLSQIELLLYSLAQPTSSPHSKPHQPLLLSGKASLSGDIRGTWPNPHASIELTGSNISFKQMHLNSLQGALNYLSGRVNISQIGLQFSQGRLEGNGYISFDPEKMSLGEKMNLTFIAEELDLGIMAALLPGENNISGLFSGKAETTGSLSHPEVTITASTSHLRFNEEELSQIKISGQYTQQHVRLSQLDISKGTGSLKGNLDLDLQRQGYTLNLSGKDLDLADFSILNPEKKSLAGKVNLHIEGKGTLEKPEFILGLAVEEAKIFDTNLESIKLEAQADGSRIHSRLELPTGKTTLEADLLLQKPYNLKGTFYTSDLDIFSFLRPIEEPASLTHTSKLSAEAEFSLPLKAWQNLSMLLKMEKTEFAYKELRIKNQHPIIIKVEEGEIVVQDLELSGTDTKLSVSGKLPMKKGPPGGVQAEGAILLSMLEPFLPGSQIDGTLVFQSNISGSLTEPHLNAQIELKKGNLTSPDIPYSLHDALLLAKIEKNIFNLEKFSLGIDEGQISAEGKISMASILSSSPEALDSPALDILVRFSGLNPGPLVQSIPQDKASQLGGLIEGHLHLQGQPNQIECLQLEGEFKKLHLFWDQFKFENEKNISFNLKNRIFSLDDLYLSQGNSFIQAGGEVDLVKEPDLDARLFVQLDTAVLAPFLENIILDGMIQLDLKGKGPVKNPVIEGRAEIKNGFLQLQDYPVSATDIKGTIEFVKSAVTLTSLEGTVNGGKIEIKGKLDYEDVTINSARLELNATGVQLYYPEGLRAQAAAHLTLERKDKAWHLTGDTQISQAHYSTNFYPGGELLNSIRLKRMQMKSATPPFLQELDLNIGLVIADSFTIDNNLANLDLTGNLRLLGTVVEPRLSGRIINQYMGEIIFGERTYQVERAEIDFLGTDPLEGRLHLIAHTQATHGPEELDITFTLTGPVSNLQYSLSSFPPRSEGELASLLITGYGTEKLKSNTANIIGNQLLQFISNPLASPVTEKIKNLLKAEEVSIKPINIATEEDPGARFTFRKGLTKQMDVVYSIDISNTQEQTWILDYSLNRNFSIQSFRKDDGSYGSSLRHRFSLGRQPPPSEIPALTQKKQARIKEVRFQGDLLFPLNILTKKIRLKKDAAFVYSDLQQSIDKLTEFYKQNQYLNTVISPEINFEDQDAVITLNISPRTPVAVTFLGDPLSQKIKNEILRTWNGRLPEDQALDEVKKLITYDLQSRGYADARVEVRKTQPKEQSLYSFNIKKGARFHIRNFLLDGQSSISADVLKKTISSIPRSRGKGLWILLYDFSHAHASIKNLFAENGYLNIKLDSPQISLNRQRQFLDITLPIDQGQQSRVHTVALQGNQRFPENELKKGFVLQENSIYRPSQLPDNINYLFNYYRSKGFQGVQISLEINPQPESPDVSLIYTIIEGDLHTISEINIYGNRRTPDYFIRRELLFKEGDVLNMEKLMMSQKKLYDLSIFKTVNIRRQPPLTQSTQERIAVEVEEDSRLAVNYGLRFNSEEKFEGFGQLDFINMFGRGRNGLLYYRQNKRQKDLRFSLASPYLLGRKFNTLQSLYYQEDTESFFKTEEIGYSLQQEINLPFNFSLSYLYRLNRIHTYELEPMGPFPFDIKLFLSELQIFLVRDTRINKLDARRGSFFSFSFTYSPEFLKSDLTYISLFCQYSLYKSLGSNLVWASNYRFGWANAFDQVLIPSKRFFAGGGNSIRGFKRDMVGPYDPFFERPEGGEALFIMNQELRFPLYKWLEGVTFFDMGNVYPTFSDFDFLDVRTSMGLGLRLNTPVALIRIDCGFNLSPLPYEPKRVLFLSIGQAF